MARFLRVLMTLVVLASGPLSVLGWAPMGSAFREPIAARSAGQAATSAAPRTATAAHFTGRDVGDPHTSPSADALRPGTRTRGGLLLILVRSLDPSDALEDQDDAFEVGDDPDVADDDDGPQGVTLVAFSGLTLPRHSAPYIEPCFWGIQPSIGHPRGDDEPPRV